MNRTSFIGPMLGNGLGMPGGGPAFSPGDDANLAWWIKADGTLWQDSGATTPVGADGDPIGKIIDAASGGHHATQSTAGKRATWKTNIQNGLPVIRADGTDDVYAFVSNVSQTFPAYLYIAMTMNDTSGYHLLLSRASGIAVYAPQNTDRKPGLRDLVGSIIDFSTTSAGFNIWRFKLDSAECGIRLNNGTEETVATAQAAAEWTSLFADITDVQFATIDLGEAILINGSAANDAAIMSYLNTRWAAY